MAIDRSRGVHHDHRRRSRVPDNDGRGRSNHDHRRGFANYDWGGVTMHRGAADLGAMVMMMNASGNQCRNRRQTPQRNQS
jgi:hypothetical protein